MEDNFIEVFRLYIVSLDPFDLEKACKMYDAPMDDFLKWVEADKILKAKFQEVCETRLIDYSVKEQKRKK